MAEQKIPSALFRLLVNFQSVQRERDFFILCTLRCAPPK
jgi:hypothetical protein